MKQILPVIFMALPLFSLSQYTYKNLHVNYAEADAAKSYTYENFPPLAALHLLHQVIAAAHGQRHDRQRRILTAARDE